MVLDKLDDTAKNNNTTVEKSNKNKAEFNAGNSTQNEFTAETSNENRTGKCIEEPIHTDWERTVFTEISNHKRAQANLPSECCELSQRLKNATFDVEESLEVFVELKQSLTEMLQKLCSAIEKEKGVTLNIPSNSKTNSNKFNVINIPPRKIKKWSRVGEKYEKFLCLLGKLLAIYFPANGS